MIGDNIDIRRWNSGQAKEFGIIHEIIATLALSCYLTTNKNEQIENYFQGKFPSRYIKEICYAFQELPISQLTRTIQLMEILIKDNEQFSEQLIRRYFTIN